MSPASRQGRPGAGEGGVAAGAEAPGEVAFGVRGPASAEELAALTVVLAALGGGDAPEPRPRVGGWGGAGTGVRRTPASGPGAWQASALPR
ncbi:acyl-CoA carboxylase epsilon subunit [Kytococcus sedentarius]|uniref:acyl-CoA carboxylase epsilon subunit n=1 Tax=Kytococcus sedentarius TaxID=1276 RepID=UPI00194F02BE|nr:acyl-CoA carboxylase epsilon subunit [Kytococcus sedentarius]QRO87911.1 acyl-CoA carboxylase subunit epsilon [Kytococcus sedentarius]